LAPSIVTYDDLVPGFEFPPASYTLRSESVAAYLKAVGQPGESAVGSPAPPTAVAVLAVRSLIQQLTLAPGSVHLQQDLEFTGVVSVGDTVTCRAGISKKHERAGLKMITFDLSVFNAAGARVMSGKTLVGILEKKP
jgi:hypothetical protein